GLRASRKLNPRARLYMGNGQREAVEAISVFYLYGFINRFVNNTIQDSRNNMVYFSAIPRDSIFKINLSNSYTNDSSMYAISNKRATLDLDSALLWHCRLGHISKKCIEELQHDGLLNSTDLRAFEKCVSCMSRKMARKPYTHQVERAKDLLGLIHTDVCSPFKIMLRQGESYFITFTDDFSRYGYVYLLKHKHEVFKNFKVFQKEVENQLAVTFTTSSKEEQNCTKIYPMYVATHNQVHSETGKDELHIFQRNGRKISSIKYALNVNANIYVLYIKQFWTSIAVKKVNDVTRLQALVNKKRVIISEATIRDALRLDDAQGVKCLPNEEIFTELARMGFEKPSTKLTFYKPFFLSQWKFLIHIILQYMSAKRMSWNEFSSSMASAVICLSTGRKFNFSKYIFNSLVRNVDSPTKFYMYPRFLQLIIRKQVGDLSSHTTKYSSPALIQKVFTNMIRVGKGCSRVETLLFEGMIVEQPVGEGTDEVHDEGVPTTGVATEGVVSVADDVVPTDVEEPSIPSLTPPTQPPPPSQDLPSTS
nr:hypothetical protein [Tanacetum cinerariifolium]